MRVDRSGQASARTREAERWPLPLPPSLSLSLSLLGLVSYANTYGLYTWFRSNYYTFTLISPMKIVMSSKFH